MALLLALRRGGASDCPRAALADAGPGVSRQPVTRCWRSRGGRRPSCSGWERFCWRTCASWVRWSRWPGRRVGRVRAWSPLRRSCVACVALLVWFWPQLGRDGLTVPVTVYMVVLGAMVCCGAAGPAAHALDGARRGVLRRVGRDDRHRPVRAGQRGAGGADLVGLCGGADSDHRGLLLRPGVGELCYTWRVTTRTRQPAAFEPIARVLPMLSVPHLDREFDYLVARRAIRRRPARGAGAASIPRQAGRRVHPGAPHRHRSRRQAGLAGPGGVRRGGAHPGDPSAGRCRRGALCRHPRRRAAAGGAAPARQGGTRKSERRQRFPSSARSTARAGRRMAAAGSS